MWLLALLFFVVLFIIAATSLLRLHPFLVLLTAAFLYGFASGRLGGSEIVEAIKQGFGGTVGAVGLVILCGTVIGTFLQKSGGAGILAAWTLRLLGPGRVIPALLLVGALVSIPVFCDSGFVVLCPLAFAMARGAGIGRGQAAIALSLGLYATHTMVPPTPGPVAAAGLLGADLAQVVLIGGAVSLPALLAGWAFAALAAKGIGGDEQASQAAGDPLQPQPGAPSAVQALLPIAVPLCLILLGSLTTIPSRPFGDSAPAEIIAFLGKPLVALSAGMLLAFGLARSAGIEVLGSGGWVGQAVKASAAIIVVTGCGGAFGRVIQASGIGQAVESSVSTLKAGVWLPFLLAAALKTAQGSSTVAMTATAAVVEPLLGSLGLASPVGRAVAVVAAGAGSMVVSHANDSYFWVVTQFSNLSVREGYRLQTLGTLVQGVVAACGLWIVARILL